MIQIQKNVDLKPYTIFKIGGRARYFCEVDSLDDFKEALSWVTENNLSFFILGAGSNVLVADDGFNGLVIRNKASQIYIDGLEVKAEAGASMARMVAEVTKTGLTGFEWAIGIPGTIGGSVRGNAGCFGSEIKDILESVEVFDIEKFKSPDVKSGSRSRRWDYQLKAASCQFRYRDSLFKHRPNLIILSATLKLRRGDKEESLRKIREYSQKRSISQDIGARCAGCIFKNVLWSRRDINKSKLVKNFPELKQFSNQEAIPAAFLMDTIGLKGTKIGSAQISTKHANYFINLGNAKTEEVMVLIGIAKERVQNHYGILLEEEIQYLFSNSRS